MALTEPERIIFLKTINAGLGAPPLCSTLGSRIILQSNNVRIGEKRLEVFPEYF
jgi:hypothetical protein